MSNLMYLGIFSMFSLPAVPRPGSDHACILMCAGIVEFKTWTLELNWLILNSISTTALWPVASYPNFSGYIKWE